MNKSQLSLSIEANAIYLVNLEVDDQGQFCVQSKHEFKFGFDLYSDVLETGRSKGMISVINDLVPALSQYPSENISVTININRTKCLVSYLEKDMASDHYKQVCMDEASKFLTAPDDYTWQAVPLNDEMNNPYNTVLLVFMPKRYLNRLQMMILPSGKTINLVDSSHMSLQTLLYKHVEPLALLEIEKNYLAMSFLHQNQAEQISYWPLSSETDIAYYSINQLQKNTNFQTILSTGGASSKDSMDFLSNALQKEVHELTLPDDIKLNCTMNDTANYLKAIGSGIKAIKEFS